MVVAVVQAVAKDPWREVQVRVGDEVSDRSQRSDLDESTSYLVRTVGGKVAWGSSLAVAVVEDMAATSYERGLGCDSM